MDSLLKTLPKAFAPKLLVKGNLTALGTYKPSDLKNDIPVFAIWDHIRELLDKHKSVIAGIKALTGTGKSLCLPQFGWAAFDRMVNVTVTEPLVPVVTDIAEKTETFYPDFVLRENLGYKTKPTKIIKSQQYGLDIVTTGVAYQLLTDMRFANDRDEIVEIFILDEVHLRNANFVYSCLDLLAAKIIAGERVCAVLTSANMERDLLFDSFVKSFSANLKIRLKGQELEDALKDPVEYFDVAPFEESYAEVTGSGNDSFRIEKFLSEDVDNAFEPMLDFIVKAKYDSKSKEYKWIGGGKGHILVFMDGNKSINSAEKYFLANIDRLPGCVIVKSTSKTHKTFSENTHLINNTPKDVTLIIFSTDVLGVGATVEGLTVLVDMAFTFKKVFVPLMRDSVVVPKPPTQSECIQKRGRAGRGSNAVTLTAMKQETYEALRYNAGALTFSELDFNMLTKSDTNSEELLNNMFTGVDPFCFQSAFNSLHKLTYWDCIDIKTLSINIVGKTVLKLTTAGMDVPEAMSILMCFALHFPVKLCVLINLLLRKYKSGGKFKTVKLKTYNDSFEIIVNEAIDFYTTATSMFEQEIFIPYFETLSKLSQMDIDTSYKFKDLTRAKIQREKLTTIAKEIYAFIYCNFMLSYDSKRNTMKLSNGVSFPYDSLKTHHLGVSWEKKTPTQKTKMFSCGTSKINTSVGKSFIVPVAVFII